MFRGRPRISDFEVVGWCSKTDIANLKESLQMGEYRTWVSEQMVMKFHDVEGKYNRLLKSYRSLLNFTCNSVKLHNRLHVNGCVKNCQNNQISFKEGQKAKKRTQILKFNSNQPIYHLSLHVFYPEYLISHYFRSDINHRGFN